MTKDRKNLLVLFDDRFVKIPYVFEHVEAIRRYSRHIVHYLPVTRRIAKPELIANYDVIILHFSVRLPFTDFLDPAIAHSVSQFAGVKIAMPQDEYDLPHITAQRFATLGIDAVFTTVPPQYRELFYPPRLTGDIEFHSCLTGYAGEKNSIKKFATSPEDRTVHLGYRGRKLPVWYGSLGAQKAEIGVMMGKLCLEHNIPHDIETSEAARINGDDWYRFLGSVRATLASESGANVLDRTGKIRAACQQYKKSNPRVSEHELYTRFVQSHDGEVEMNQISPKIFEAIRLRTGLVLFEGNWSGVLKPFTHYIPLKKDYSNSNQVFEILADVARLKEMTDRAYSDIIESKKWSYRRLSEQIDKVIDQIWFRNFAHVEQSTSTHLPPAHDQPVNNEGDWPDGYPMNIPRQAPNYSILRGPARTLWMKLPAPVRNAISSHIGTSMLSFIRFFRRK